MMDHAHVAARIRRWGRLPWIQLGLAAAWLGLLTGLAELLILAIRDASGAAVTLDMLWRSRHSGWMIPASNMILFSAVAMALGGMRRFGFRVVTHFSAPILGAMAMWAILERIPDLHAAAKLVLAAGVGYRVGRWVSNRPGGFQAVVRWSAVPLGLLVAIGGPLLYLSVIRSETRSVAALAPPRLGSPNVLLLVLDTVRMDHLSTYGYERETTPNITRLAREAVRFDGARSTAPWTLPSHASMFTGRWPHELSTRVDRALDDRHTTLAEYLASKGYATAGFVANTYYCNSLYGLGRGFARYEDFPEKDRVSATEILRSSSIGRRVADVCKLYRRRLPGEAGARKSAKEISGSFLNWASNQKDRPFFAFLNFYDAHDPYQPPAGASHQFMNKRPEAERAQILRDFERLAHGKKRGTGSPRNAQELVKLSREIFIDSYDDCLHSLDAELGVLFAELDRRGLRDETIIILTSDHGEQFGEHELFGHGVSLYEPEVRVPLLVFAPGLPRGRRVENPVSLRDLPATIADLIGEGERHPFPGESLATRWQGSKLAAEPILTEVEQQKKFAPSPNIPASVSALQGMIKGSWAFIRGGQGEQLFDLSSDPHQQRDLAKVPGLASMVKNLGADLDEIGSRTGPIPKPQMTKNAGLKDPVIR